MDAVCMPPLRPAARGFRDLLVWRKAHEFVLAIYQFTASFPKQETYGLALQSSWQRHPFRLILPKGFDDVARPKKHAIGTSRKGQAKKRYYLILTQDLGYGDTAQLTASLEEVSGLLYAYRTAMLTSSISGL